MTYLPALDGLRGISVSAVLLYHAGVSWMPGGFLGVEIFFVISGYLITSLLLGEHRRSGGIDLKSFWVRRARRLLPALFALLAAVAAVWLVFLPDEVAKVRGDIVSAFTYVTNWHLIFTNQSYFDSFGRPSPVKHLWSLAVEEQFYLLWPLIFAGLVALTKGRRKWMVAAVGAGILLSISVGIWLYDPNGDPSRVYYGLDTRAAGLLAGSLLGIIAPPWVLRGGLRRSARIVLDVVGGLAAVVLGWMLFRIGEYDSFLYEGGFLVVDLATVVVILVLAHPGGFVNRTIFSWKPLVWVGTRSYGIYLWHFPVFVLTRPDVDVGFDGPLLFALRIAITLFLAEASYRLVETPIRGGAIRRLRERMRSDDAATVAAARRRAQVAISGFAGVVLVLGIGLVAAQRSTAAPEGFGDVAPASALGTLPSGDLEDATTTTAPPTTAAPTTATTAAPPTTAAPATTAPPTSLAPTSGESVVVVGDSVPLGASGALDRRMPGIKIYAEVGQQFSAAPGIMSWLNGQGLLRPVVVIHLGSNGTVSHDDLTRTLTELAGAQRVVLVNTHVPRPWQDSVNQTLSEVVGSGAYPNVVLADWHGLSAGHPEWFVSDNTHLSTSGVAAYADLVAQAALG